MKKLILFALLALLAAGCAAQPEVVDVEEQVVEEAPVLLNVTGLVAEDTAFTEQDLLALGTQDVDYTNKDGVTSTYNGVLLASVLEAAGMASDAVTLLLVASDGYEAELTLADLATSPNAIVAFDGGSLRVVAPDLSSKVQVRELVEIKVQ